MPDGVQVTDFGIRGVHLAYQLMDGYDARAGGRSGTRRAAGHHLRPGARPRTVVLEAVERRAAGRPVDVVRIRAGAMHRVVGSAMATAFDLASTGTVAQGARLEVVPVQVTCRSCGLEVESDDPYALCTRCGSPDLDLLGGDELTLESITFHETPADVRPEGPREEQEMSHVPRHPG
jgi:hydrogenase nickel incorporation protein HypA/HybF